MRTRQRAKRDVWYANYSGVTETTDEAGYYTGEFEISYTTPTKIRASVSPATGQSNAEMFGNIVDYDHVIVVDDPDIVIDENSVVWLDSVPTDGGGVEGYNYIVRRVARSWNFTAIAVRDVNVTVPVSETPDTPDTPTDPDAPLDDSELTENADNG